jgi:hypothetical protein
MEKNYIPNISFEIDNFENFINERTKLIKNKLRKILLIK